MLVECLVSGDEDSRRRRRMGIEWPSIEDRGEEEEGNWREVGDGIGDYGPEMIFGVVCRTRCFVC